MTNNKSNLKKFMLSGKDGSKTPISAASYEDAIKATMGIIGYNPFNDYSLELISDSKEILSDMVFESVYTFKIGPDKLVDIIGESILECHELAKEIADCHSLEHHYIEYIGLSTICLKRPHTYFILGQTIHELW